MTCSNCGGRLVVEETTTYPIDETGRFFTTPHSAVMRLVCEVCRADFEYDHTPIGGGFHSISPKANTTPRPAARVFVKGDVDTIIADRMVGVVEEEGANLGAYIPEVDKGYLDIIEKEARDAQRPTEE